MFRVAILAVSATLVMSSTALAGETQWKALSCDQKAGQLKLPLTVHERSGVERRAAVVTSGVPFPAGFLPDVNRLAVVDRDGKPVVCQATAMVKWHKPAYDDSVQWALVSFQADVPANGTATYYLIDNGKAGPASPLKVSKGEPAITVDTGAASFVIPVQGSALISKASIGGMDVIGGQGLRPTITAGDWPDRSLKAGDKQVGEHTAAGVTVEESGPARVVVCVKGGFTPSDKDKKFYDFTARLYFTAGSPAVRAIYTINNGKLDPTLYADGKGKSRLAYVWPITDASLVADLTLNGKPTVATLVEDKPLSEAADGEPLKIFQSALDSYKATTGGKESASGTRHLGVMDVADGKSGVAVARRYFREEWPTALAASAKELRIGLLPAEAGEVFPLNLGMRKSWDIRLTLHGAQGPDLKGCFNEQDALLLFRPDPAWMVWAGAQTGAWSNGLVMGKPAKAPAIRRDHAKLAPSLTGGWDGFGVISSWNAGGAHWNEMTVFADWVSYGDGAEFDKSEISALWGADMCPIQFDSPDLTVFFPYLAHGTATHCRLKTSTYPGYTSRDKWGRPDTGHMGMWMWQEYYLLTGDQRAREAVCHLGDMARSHLWKWTHEDKADGTGPLPGKYQADMRKYDPDADPDFKLDRRYTGWPLYCLAQYYQLTADPAMLAEGSIIARGFRNTGRCCPIGQLVKDPAGKDGNPAIEYSPNIVSGHDGTAGQIEWSKKSASLASSNFYSGIIMYGLREYYLVSKDVEALDTLVGQIDRFCHYSLVRTPEGKPAGWSYIFGDYWGPYTWEDAMKDGKSAAIFTVSNELPCDALARIYPLTGRADLMEVLQAAAKANRWGNNRVLSLFMTVDYPKVHGTPPPAIKDLAAEPVGGGKVRLTWTAPGGAAWYQVKFTAAATMVERVKGWPDRTDPLPTTPAEWLAKANAFNARQRSFWASNNVAAPAPKPGVAGAKESMVVEGVPAGRITLGIKSWDAADNISELSNVVPVEVK